MPETTKATIISLAHDGRGIAHVNGKTVFIEGALPGEEVNFQCTQRSRQFDQGQMVEILHASPDRVEPHCLHTDVCGGCRLQHLTPEAQLRDKQQILLEQLQHFGKITPPTQLMPPMTAAIWGYRRKARMSVRYVTKKNRVLVGFHEKNGRYVADIKSCVVLHPAVGTIITDLQDLIAKLSIFRAIPQIEVAVGDHATVLVLRHLQPIPAEDKALLLAFAKQHNIIWYVQPGNESTVAPLDKRAALTYALPAFDLIMDFEPLDFVQINAEINQKLVSRAVELLDIKPEDRVLDLFCGLGNFSLALARQAAQVVGVEGSKEMVLRAKHNATRNQISNAEFYMADLNEGLTQAPWAQQKYDKLLLDPARTGAFELVQKMAKLGASRIVYVSCNPATFARDAGELVNNQGYVLQELGVLDMFPHTKHVESIALFVKEDSSHKRSSSHHPRESGDLS
jgi:23S rRNA (uracil1939-C5)-methyltransferase